MSSSAARNEETTTTAGKKPKRSLTAYNIFFKEQRQRILLECGGTSGGFANLARTIAARWKTISSEEHEECCRKAAVDKSRYQREMAVWLAKQGSNNSTELSPAGMETLLEEFAATVVDRDAFSIASYSSDPTSSSEASRKYMEQTSKKLFNRMDHKTGTLSAQTGGTFASYRQEVGESQRNKRHRQIGGTATYSPTIPQNLEWRNRICSNSLPPAALRSIFDEEPNNGIEHGQQEERLQIELDEPTRDLLVRMLDEESPATGQKRKSWHL